jgi:hypothetical protein
MIVADEISSGTDVVGPFLGERQRFTYQTRQALPQRVVEAFNVISFPGVFRNSLVPLHRNHACARFVPIRMKPGLLARRYRDIGPECFGTVATPIADMKRHDLACLRVHSDPDPWLVGSLPHNAPKLVGFSLVNNDLGWPCRSPDMEVIGTRRTAFHHIGQQPRETDTYRTTDPAQRNALAPQVFNQRALLVSNEVVFGAGHTRASTRVAWMMLFADARMAIFLVVVRLTRWARIDHDHRGLLTSAVLGPVWGQQEHGMRWPA